MLISNSKTCNRCLKRKSLELFYKDKTVKSGLRSICKECDKVRNKNCYENNRDRKIEYQKNYYEENKEEINEKKKVYSKKYRPRANELARIKYNSSEAEKEKSSKRGKKYYNENKNRVIERQKRYVEDNYDKVHAYRQQYRIDNEEKIAERQKQHRQKPENRLALNLRRRVLACLKGHNKSASTLKLIGCTREELISHIESQFKPGMLWDNYGVHGWHIDHIRPCSSFNLTDPEQQQECFHYTNLQPLWAEENLSKGSKYEY